MIEVPAGLFTGENFEAIAELNAKMDPLAGPTSEVILLRRDPAVLVFRVFHGTMDGKGALLWIEQVFRALRGEALAPILGTDTDASLVRRLPHRKARPPMDLRVQTHRGRVGTGAYRVWRQRLSLPGHPGAMVARVAALLCERSHGARNRFLVPVDLRRHDPGLLCQSNLTLPIFLEAHKGEAWPELHGRLLAALQANEELNLASADLGWAMAVPGWLRKGFLRLFSGWQSWRGRTLFGAVLSDLGHVELGRLAAPGFEAQAMYSLTVQQPFASHTVAIASHRHGTEVMVSCYDEERERELALGFLRDLQASLEDGLPGRTIFALLKTVVREHGDRPAVEGEGEHLSHAQLDHRSRVVARNLIEAGVQRGDRIAWKAGRGLDLLPTLLGLWRVGASVVPIDEETPAARTAELLKLAGVRLCVTEQPVAFGVPNLAPASLRGGDPDLGEPRCRPEDVAYLMFTSGSSGRPRPVLVEHHSLLAYLEAARHAYAPGQRADSRCSPRWSSTAPVDHALAARRGRKVLLLPNAPVWDSIHQAFAGSHDLPTSNCRPHLSLACGGSMGPRGDKILIVGGDRLSGVLAHRALPLIGEEARSSAVQA
ncbi:MAG: AMP-binding protein [Planctomycetota bacterium]